MKGKQMTETISLEITTKFKPDTTGGITQITTLVIATNEGKVEIPCKTNQVNAMIQDATKFFEKYLNTNEMAFTLDKQTPPNMLFRG